MTITYSLDVSSSTFLGFHRLLFRWKGSIWKSILPELVCWLFTYYALSISYRKMMKKEQQMLFEDICMFFHAYSDYIPITFMLGFYVSAVFNRWNEMFTNLGWIDSPALLIATILRGTSEEARMIRRNIVRYLVLVQAMVYRDISAPVKKRFPTMDHLVTAGIMTADELKEFDSVETEHIKYWTPIQWTFLLARRARDLGLIDSDIIYVDLLEKIRQYRINVLTLTLYDWVPIPLVYTQVVNLAVRLYFVLALFARQFLKDFGSRNLANKTSNIDLFVPVMTILQFLFFMGWIKVAEVLLNPMGEDDDDFETNWIIDRNLQCGLMIVDECYGRMPPLEKDQFWEQSNAPMLYTKETANRPQNPMMGSCNDAQQREDALLLQPRRRRLMSTAATAADRPFGSIESDKCDTKQQIVPVQNHNPQRRNSVVHNLDGIENRKTSTFLDTVRRKFSRSSGTFQSRRKTSTESGDFERGHSTRVSANSVTSTGSGSVQNFLWGGKRKTTAKSVNGEAAQTCAKPQHHVHFDLDKTGQKEEAIGGMALPVIIEEESEMTRMAADSNATMSTSNTSLESASSTSSSTGGGKEGRKDAEERQKEKQ